MKMRLREKGNVNKHHFYRGNWNDFNQKINFRVKHNQKKLLFTSQLHIYHAQKLYANFANSEFFSKNKYICEFTNTQWNNLKNYCAWLFRASWDFLGQVNIWYHLPKGQVNKNVNFDYWKYTKINTLFKVTFPHHMPCLTLSPHPTITLMIIPIPD